MMIEGLQIRYDSDKGDFRFQCMNMVSNGLFLSAVDWAISPLDLWMKHPIQRKATGEEAEEAYLQHDRKAEY